MDARLVRAAVLVAALCSLGASYRTRNFIVTAPTSQLAREICEKAEADRRRLAIEWLGSELPPWSEPCPITAHVGNLGAGGATSFMFDHGRPFGWTMTIQGTRERILDSVLPHEVTHTIFATHFGQPLPRWADEGACTTVEATSERRKQDQMLIQFLTTNRGIAFNRMFAMREYPRDVLPLYAQGYSLARFLIAQGGRRKFVQYIGDGLRTHNWPAATRKHYGFRDLSHLQVTWLDWVRRGSPPLQSPAAPAPEAIAEQQTQPQPEAVAQQDAPSPPAPQPPASERSSAVASADEPASDATAVATATTAQPAAPLVPVQPPPANQLAQITEIRSWYLQQRDLARARGKETEPPTDVPLLTRSGTYAPGSIKTATTAPSTQLTRPQPIGRPQQTVIQWSQSDSPAARLSGQLPASAGSFVR